MKTLFFTDIWNDSVESEPRQPRVRDYAWASEMGKPLIDRYLTMTGVDQSNPPNVRSLRKFWAGNVWEFVAGLVLAQLGIIHEKQQEVWVDDSPIRVKGKLDYLLGGTPNYSRARDFIKSLPFQKEMMERFMKVIDKFEQKIGNEEITPMVHEIKSCSQYVIEKLGNGGNIEGHDLQIYHYLRGLNMDEGHIDYISKDDALMAERIVGQSATLKNKYDSDLLMLKGYLDAGERPPLAPMIMFEEKFTKNFGVEYSGYLTLLYGFERPDEYSDSVKGKIASWNRVLARIKMIEAGTKTKTGKPILLTDKNKAAVDEMHREGYDAFNLALVARVEEEEEVAA